MKSWPEGLRASVPLALPTAAVGASFGLLAAPVLGPWPTILMSLLVWSGTAQFAALSILTGGGGPVLAATTALLSNTRFLPMGFAVAPSMTSGPLRRFLTGAMLADASFLVAHREGGRYEPAVVAWAWPVQYGSWALGTVAGVVGASSLGDPARWGLDVLFPVFYLSLLLPELFPERDRPQREDPEQRQRPDRRPLLVAGVAAVIVVVLIPVAPPGVPVLAAAAAALIGLWPTGRRERSA